MKRFLYSCSLFIFSLNLSVNSYADLKTSVSASQKAEKSAKISSINERNHTGPVVGLGFHVGVQRTDIDINKEFTNAPVSSNTMVFGGSGMIGYEHSLGGKFSIGLEIGADFGKNAQKTQMGGYVRNNSTIFNNYNQRRSILAQMFRNIANAFDTGTIVGDTYIIDINVYSQFIRSMRYIGNNSDFLLNGGNAFMTSNADGGGIFSNAGIANVNAVFADAIGDNVLENIRILGNGSFNSGYDNIREFITNNLPTISYALGHMANQTIATSNVAVTGPSVAADGTTNGGTLDGTNIHWQLAERLNYVFATGGVLHATWLGVDGILDDNVFMEALASEFSEIYDPNNTAIKIKIDAYAQKALQNLNKKTNYGICPYFSVKFGYFLDEINSQLYFKLGITQLQGYIASVNDFINVSEKFKVTTPLIGIGISKQINEKVGISAEISHAFKTHKKLKDITYYGHSVENKVKLSKTNFRVLATYSF